MAIQAILIHSMVKVYWVLYMEQEVHEIYAF